MLASAEEDNQKAINIEKNGMNNNISVYHFKFSNYVKKYLRGGITLRSLMFTSVAEKTTVLVV